MLPQIGRPTKPRLGWDSPLAPQEEESEDAWPQLPLTTEPMFAISKTTQPPRSKTASSRGVDDGEGVWGTVTSNDLVSADETGGMDSDGGSRRSLADTPFPADLLNPAERLSTQAAGLATWGAARNGARVVLTSSQKNLFVILLAVCAAVLVLVPLITHLDGLVVLLALATLMYFVSGLHKVWMLTRVASVHGYAAHDTPLADADLPTYTVLVPLHHEHIMMPVLIQRLSALDYPTDRWQALLLVETEDDETINALTALQLPTNFQMLLVPPGEPKTKPRALNFGLAHATSEYVVVYDAEDEPEPDQLRKAAAAFAQLPPQVVCLQARLDFYNRKQSLLARLFALDYLLWYTMMLPGLTMRSAFIPLGGTSNHFRRAPLVRIGGWDPYNVTEDCDIGARISRARLQVAMLDSVTGEEAVTLPRPWTRQRSRWIKGYMQTYLVHMRQPIKLLRDTGLLGWIDFNLLVGGTVFALLVNPLMWLMTIVYIAGAGTPVDAWIQSLFPAWIYYPAVLCQIAGNFLFIYVNVYASVRYKYYDLTPISLLGPFYWVLMSAAAWRALGSLIVHPFQWNKTTHGVSIPLDRSDPVNARVEAMQWWVEASQDRTGAPALSFVLPAYNEEQNIERTVRACLSVLNRICPAAEVIVVDDGSSDRTGAIVDELAQEDLRVRPLHQPNQGYGGALLAGIAAARGHLVSYMDSDGQFDPDDLEGLVHAQLENPSAVVLGYRQRRADPFIRRMNAFGWKRVIRLSLGLRGIRDIDCGFKLFPTHVIQACAVSAHGAMVSAELLTKVQRLHVRVVQVPVQHLPRQYGQATGANVRVILRAFSELRVVMAHLRNWQVPVVVASDWASDRGGPYAPAETLDETKPETKPVAKPVAKKETARITAVSAVRSRVLSRVLGARRLTTLFLGLSLLALLAGSTGLYNVHAQAASPGATSPGDWPKFLYDYANTSDAVNETQLTAAGASGIYNKWQAKTGNTIAASPTVVGGVVYVGSWDGYEYAFNASTGAKIWKTFLGTDTQPCNPGTIGVTSAASVVNGVVYVGGGNDYWYALNATNGAILWDVYTGDTTQGWYNWSSPVIYNGFAYVGIASDCDNPLIPGQLWKVNLTTHNVDATVNFVPPGEVGGGVWTTPAIDTATNTVFVSTATQNQMDQTISEAIVSLDANTLAVKGWWQVPFSEKGNDSDWGTSPVLMTDSLGRQLVTATNKNGVLYAFNRNDLNPGPLWQDNVAYGGDCPPCGDGSISSGAYASNLTIGSVTGVLFVAGGNTEINGVGYQGYVRAIDPATGNILWQHGTTNGPVWASLAYGNGVIAEANGHYFEILNATTGQSLYTQNLGGVTYSAPTISNGNIYIGSGTGRLWDFAIGSLTVPPPDPNCPSGWTCQDMGTNIPGSESVAANGVLTVNASGYSNLNGTTDEFRLITQEPTGNFQVVTKMLTQSMQGPTNVFGPEAGLIVRENNTPGSPFYGIFEYPENNPENQPQPTMRIWYRTAFSSGPVQANRYYPTPLPQWLMIQRNGDTLSAATSTDGTHWNLLPGSQTQVVMPAAVMAGIAQNAITSTTSTPPVTPPLGTNTYSNYSVGPITVTPNPSGVGTGCQTGWQCQDVGTPSPSGNEAYSSGTWTVDGTGPQIGYQTDSFHYVAQSLTGDGTISARITSQQNTANGAVAGLMMRANFSSGSSNYGIFVTPGDGMLLQYRLHNGLQTYQLTPPTGTLPIWLRITRYTDTTVSPSQQIFSAYTSTDGINWTFVPWSSVAIPEMSGTILAGMAADADSSRSTSAVTYTNVTTSTASISPPTTCPAGWSCNDVGYPIPAGGQSLQNGTWQLSGGGEDIWSTYDQFHFVDQTQPGDTTITAQITGQTNDDTWAKSGVMLRASTDPQAPYYAELMTPGNGIVIQYRQTQGGTTDQIALSGTVPAYLRIARWGDTSTSPTTEYFTTYTSTDGTTWQEVPGSTVVLNITGPILVGMADTPHDTAGPSVATFDNVQIQNTAVEPSTVCPSGWSCADIGNPTPAGSQELNGANWTIDGGGGDIWDTSDAFHYIYQSLTTDGSVSAQVTSQTNASPWAKAGVMLRATTDPGSPYYAAFVTPSNGIAIQYRAAQGVTTSQLLIAGTVPAYLQVSRYTDTSVTPNVEYFTAYTSPDGVNWTAISGSTVSINMTGTMLAGMAVTSHNTGELSAVGMDAVTVGAPAVPPVQACVSGWSCADIGNPTPAGGQLYESSTWTIFGGGGDIWDTSDAFHYIYQSLTTDGSVSAQVTSQTNTSPWAKAGVMLRATTDPGSPYYAAFVTPSNGIAIQYRTTQGATTSQLLIAGTVPAYLAVARSGTTFTAYTSPDGVTWTAVPNSAITINMTGTLLAGMAVTSHNISATSTAMFDAVQVGSGGPSAKSSPAATSTPSVVPTATPTPTPSVVPTATPTPTPSVVPTATPTPSPSVVPSSTPTP